MWTCQFFQSASGNSYGNECDTTARDTCINESLTLLPVSMMTSIKEATSYPTKSLFWLNNMRILQDYKHMFSTTQDDLTFTTQILVV